LNDGGRPARGARSPLAHLFNLVTAYPRTTLVVWSLVFLGFASQIPKMTRESGADEYIPPDHPAVKLWQETNERFDLYEPVVVLIDTGQPMGIFSAESLSLLNWYTEQLGGISGIEGDSIQSLFTEKRLNVTDDGIGTLPLVESFPETERDFEVLREKVMGFPLHLGRLVSRDGSAAAIAARLTDPDKGGDVYDAILALEERAPVGDEAIHVAGQPIASEYLEEYLDEDSKRMTIAVILLIGPVLFFSYRTLRAVLLPGTSALCGAAVALGAMSLLNVPFLVLTNVLPSNVMGLGVAYGIHILREYYEQTAQNRGETLRETVVNVMLTMRRPIIYATLTDIVGFIALSVTSHMPPMQMMGRFAALGITATLFSTLVAIPAALVLLPVRPSPALRPDGDGTSLSDLWTRLLTSLGRYVVKRPRTIIAVSILLLAFGIYSASFVQVNDSRLNHFHPSEPIHVAVTAFDRVMDGTLNFDILIEAEEPEALYRPENLARIEALQRHLETIPHVKGTISLVDYFKEMNRAMSGGDPESFVLPDSEEAIAQYALLYSMGELDAMRHIVDDNYRTTVVRALCNSGLYSDAIVIREQAEQYLAREFDGPGLSAQLSGRLSVDYEWMRHLESSHFLGAVLALVTVWTMTAIGFRHWSAGIYCLVPVLATLIAVYAVMGISGIWLGLGTSAFASIAIGITVNFSIHELDRVVHLVKGEGMTLENALQTMFSTTGRAVFFNFLCLFLGIFTLTFSQLPPLQWFGVLLSTALAVGFVTSLVLLPALVIVFRPRFLGR